MSTKTDADYLRDMLHYAEEAGSLVVGRDLHALNADTTLRYALQYCVLIIGEAATVPWREIVGMRNWLVHGYSAIRASTLWDTAVQDLPNLVEAILNHLPPEQT